MINSLSQHWKSTFGGSDVIYQNDVKEFTAQHFVCIALLCDIQNLLL